ncbi:MAG: hypothetical protein P4L84_14250 [Isosphaeraceae bacterium]|nr:hypothetical protein [Isosphaeraceae bacterium]
MRLSRKLTFVAGLLACFSCATSASLGEDTLSPAELASTHPIVGHLSSYLQKTPLEIVASTVLEHEPLRAAAAQLFESYDAFLALIGDPGKRQHLEDLAPADASSDALYQDARAISHTFQAALDRIFLEDNGTELARLSKTYGVF